MVRSLRAFLSRFSPSTPPRLTLEAVVGQVLDLHQRNGGATFSLYFGDQSGERLYAVSVFPERNRVLQGSTIRPEVLAAFVTANRDLLADPRCCIGTWYNAEDGLTYLDVSVALTNKRAAIGLAKRYNQIGIFDLRLSRVIPIGGTGLPPDDMPPAKQRLPLR